MCIDSITFWIYYTCSVLAWKNIFTDLVTKRSRFVMQNFLPSKYDFQVYVCRAHACARHMSCYVSMSKTVYWPWWCNQGTPCWTQFRGFSIEACDLVWSIKYTPNTPVDADCFTVPVAKDQFCYKGFESYWVRQLLGAEVVLFLRYSRGGTSLICRARIILTTRPIYM